MLVLRLNPSIMQPESLACRQSSESLMFQPTPRLVSAGNGRVWQGSAPNKGRE